MAKVAIIAHYAESLINFRGKLIEDMINRGHKVKAFAPEDGYKGRIYNLGAEYETISLQRTGLNPLADLKTLVDIYIKLKNYDPDVVFSYAIKPVIYGGIAARFNKVNKVYSLIPGLGSMFIGEKKNSFVFKVVNFLYRVGLVNSDVVFFQNPDDQALFKRLNLVHPKNKTIVVNGSGVDINHYYYTEQVIDPISFLFIGRIIEDKGIKEYISAAKMIKDKYPGVEFKILGPFDTNPSALKKNYINKWVKEGIINYLGQTDDVRPYIAESSVFVLPSYREGTPRSTLEAMSMGRPVITTDAPGCKETVEDGKNGFIVPVKDSKQLANAIERFIINPELIVSFGKESREIAEEKYSVDKVNKVMLEGMGL